MTEFFVCCFRSCLRGKDSENNQEYYDRLGLTDRNCSTEDIKRAFKRKSLEMHPDKLAQRGKSVTAEDQVAFQKMKDAYDCLSDPSKRRYYDEFGEGGLRMVESTQKMNFMDLLRNFQDNKFDCVLITLLLCIFFIFVLALPILICLKVDGIVTTSWYLIWIPMWVVDTILLTLASLNLCCCVFDSTRNEDDEDAQPDQNASIPTKLYYFMFIVLFVATQITLVMKADGILTDSWLVAFIPLFAFEILIIAGSLPIATSKLEPPDYSAISGLIEDPIEMQFTRIQMDNEHHQKMLDKMYNTKTVYVSCIRIAFVVLLALKLDDDASMNWGLVFLPVYIYFIGQLIWSTYLAALGAKMLRSVDTEIPPEHMDPVTQAEYQRGMTLLALGNSESCGLFLPITLSTLLLLYLTIGGFSSFIVMIPIFIVIGCCMCCTFCSLAFVSNVDVDKMEAQMEHNGGGGRGSSFSKETDNLNRKNTGRNSYGTGNHSSNSSSTYAPPPPIDPNLQPKDMSLKQLRQAISEAGLSAEAVGLSEKQEFVTLLENYRVRTTAADIRVAEAASARTRQQASVSSSSTGDID